MDTKQIFSDSDQLEAFLTFLVETGPPFNESLIEAVRTEISDSMELDETERNKLADAMALMITRYCKEALNDEYR